MTMQEPPFNSEMLEALLNMDEGPTLDFKREQYPFENETVQVKGELLKDILAMVNTHRYRTAYILVGVEEDRGGRSVVVGVDQHWEDASLHQFVNNKTNRPAAFSYFPFSSDGKRIGVFSIPIQRRPVYLLADFGKLTRNTVYVRDGSSTRGATPDEIADMGRTNLPRLVEWSIARLLVLARNAIVSTAEQGQGRPGRYSMSYDKAREWVLKIVDERIIEFTDAYSAGMDSYRSLHWVFEGFEKLASYCTQTIRTIGPALIDSGALMRAIVEIEDCINLEKRVWDEFRIRMDGTGSPLPVEANFNLLSVAARTVRFIDVLEDEEQYGNLDHCALNSYRQPIFLRSNKWGEWRR